MPLMAYFVRFCVLQNQIWLAAVGSRTQLKRINTQHGSNGSCSTKNRYTNNIMLLKNNSKNICTHTEQKQKSEISQPLYFTRQFAVPSAWLLSRELFGFYKSLACGTLFRVDFSLWQHCWAEFSYIFDLKAFIIFTRLSTF